MSDFGSNGTAGTPVHATGDFTHEEIKDTLGSGLLGVFFGLILYGIIIHQFYRYCRTFPSDATFIRALIILVLVLETTHTAITMHYPYVFLVTNFGNGEAVIHGTWSVNMLSLMGGLITISSQLFFICRIYLIGPLRYRILAAITIVLLISEIPLATYVMQGMFENGLQIDIRKFKRVFQICLLIPTVVDTLLTSTLIIVLRRSRAGLNRNDGIIDLIVMYGINTGLLHWALNLSCFLSLVVVSDPFVSPQFSSINIVVARVYAITFLSVLNSRETTRSEAFFSGGTYGLKVIERANRRAMAEKWNVPQLPDDEPTQINISVTTEMDNEQSWDGPKRHYGETATGSSERDCTI